MKTFRIILAMGFLAFSVFSSHAFAARSSGTNSDMNKGSMSGYQGGQSHRGSASTDANRSQGNVNQGAPFQGSQEPSSPDSNYGQDQWSNQKQSQGMKLAWGWGKSSDQKKSNQDTSRTDQDTNRQGTQSGSSSQSSSTSKPYI